MLPRLGGRAGLGGLTNVVLLVGELSISCEDDEVDDMDVERKDEDEATLVLSIIAGFGNMVDDDDT